MKVIGCGNAERGDDRAGLLVAERLRQLGFRAEAHSGDPLSLFEKWNATDKVVVVDAVVTGSPPGTVFAWDRELPRVPDGLSVSSHGFDIAKAIELAQTLEKLPAHLLIYGIEGRQFELGSNLSPEVALAVEAVVQRIADQSF